ncbi:uncharacterized protein LOC124926375 [Impatiens glandulifera]|uniref:uncharacterized protein LOC124926375 n=1 Tax=Impatiens glandulifera TaxID=253017 RepID=UPI001FB0CC2B|nr:uncharacterized protein LOC124926375 [Impatiens glandulifera]
MMEISESGMNPSGKSEQLKVDTDEDCIENLNIEKEGSLKHNLDVLEALENHLGRTTPAASEEIASVATPSLEKTSMEITALNVAPSNFGEGDTIVDEDRNLGSIEVQVFSTEVESRQEEDNSPDESVQVFHTKEANEVNLEEDAKDRETIELDKSPQNLSSFEDTLNGKDENNGGLIMAVDKIKILPPHGSNGDAEFSSTADDDVAIAILTVSDIEKEGRHNLDETPIPELGNTTVSEEIAFADSTSANEHRNREFDIERDIKGVEYGTTITHNLGFVAEQSTKPVVEVPLQDHLSTEIGMSHQEEHNSPADYSVQVVHTKGNDSGLTMAKVRPNENNTADNLKMIPQSDSMNQIEKVVYKKQDDILLGGKHDEMEMISQIPVEIVVDKHLSEEPKLPRDDDDEETEMISQIHSEVVVDKRMSEDSISNNNGNSVVNGASSAINEFLSNVESQNNHLLLAKQQQFDGSSSQGEDSVEGIWGSISVLSTQSDPHQCLNTTVPLQPDTTAKSVNPFDEPPSFMTLVEDHPLKDKQQQIVQKTEEPKSQLVLQAAAFPSITNTNITKESAGRKKNEEIITKIANWGMDKQHTPLKSLLLSETNLNSSPNWMKQQQQTEEENSSSLKKKSDNPPPPPPAGKGWNSPARYPNTDADEETKKEKRKKGKGRPNWIQCVCCSSVH